MRDRYEDIADVDPFVLHLFAALAEKERALISIRTRQALSAAKARGVSLGNPKLNVARKSAVEAVKSEANRYAANVLPIIREAQKAGASTLRQIADALNARGIGCWSLKRHTRTRYCSWLRSASTLCDWVVGIIACRAIDGLGNQ